MSDIEAAWAGLRRRVGQALGPLAARRTGWFYVVRRAVAEGTARALRARPARVPGECVEVDDLPARFPSVTVHPVVPEERFAAMRLPEPAASEPLARPVLRPWVARAQVVSEIPDGVVFGASGWVGVDDEHLLVTGAMARWRQPVPRILRACDRDRRGALLDLPGRTANLIQALVVNYSHSMLQGVPVIDAIDRTIGLHRIDRFLLRDGLPPYAFELLDRMGIPSERRHVVPSDEPRRYRCEVLVAASYSDANIPGTRNAVEPVRRWFAPELDEARRDESSRRRWYITRSRTSTRGVVNDADVRSVLADRGFEPLVMDGRRVAEQAALVAHGECIVGLHGAAMANLVFATPGTPVVELMPRNLVGWTFARLSAANGLPYTVLLGTEPGLPWWVHRNFADPDTVVDVGALASSVDAVLDR